MPLTVAELGKALLSLGRDMDNTVVTVPTDEHTDPIPVLGVTVPAPGVVHLVLDLEEW